MNNWEDAAVFFLHVRADHTLTRPAADNRERDAHREDMRREKRKAGAWTGEAQMEKAGIERHGLRGP